MKVTSSKSRLEVSHPIASCEVCGFEGIASQKTRAEVLADLASSKANGDFRSLNGEAQRL